MTVACEYENCGKTFSRNAELQRHIKQVHLKIKDKQCSDCDMKFSTSGDLQRHIKSIHLQVKDKQCSDCAMIFSTNVQLQRHIKQVHLKIKDHPCTTCDMKFSTNADLQRHIKKCTGKMNCSAGELKIMNTLKEMGIEYEFDSSYQLKNENGKLLRWDFIIKTKNEPLFIEYDGRAHFMPVNFGGISQEKAESNLIKQQAHDKLKNDYCNENGYLLLRIPYTQFGNIPQLLTEFICENSDWEG